MIGAFIVGSFWGILCWMFGYGYFFFFLSKKMKKRIYSSKFLIFCVDAAIIGVFGSAMKAAGGISAGIAMAILTLLCFITSMILYACNSKVKLRPSFATVRFPGE